MHMNDDLPRPVTAPGDDCEVSEARVPLDGVHEALEAVTTLADRLNALALRVALMGGITHGVTSEVAVEAYLNRLSALVILTGDQMQKVQRLLQALEAGTSRAEDRATRRSE
jgi:endonuclease V-like protein UPF0215 family